MRPLPLPPPFPLLGGVYRHGPTGRPVVVIDHEFSASGRTGRLVLRFNDTPMELRFAALPVELGSG